MNDRPYLAGAGFQSAVVGVVVGPVEDGAEIGRIIGVERTPDGEVEMDLRLNAEITYLGVKLQHLDRLQRAVVSVINSFMSGYDETPFAKGGESHPTTA